MPGRTTQPINVAAIPHIRELLEDRPRDYALFVIGLNTGLRAGDLCRLRLGDFITARAKFRATLRVKTRKRNRWVEVAINSRIRSAVYKWMQDNPRAKCDSFLFYSTTRGYGKNYEAHITPSHVSRLVRAWCESVGEFGHAAHSLRKTRAATLYRAAAQEIGPEEAILVAAKTLGHKSIKTTADYLGMSREKMLSWQAKVGL